MALALGEPNPDVLAGRIPHRILGEWEKFYQISPFGDYRGDIQAGVIASTVANAISALIASLAGKGRKAKEFHVKEFIPDFEPKAAKTPDELLQKVKDLNAMMGGTFQEGAE